MGPLSGVKVLDLSRILAGPWASQMLSDYGALVWKIEHPQKGDDTRHWGSNHGSSDENQSPYFQSANRGKHSIAIDITTTAGQNIVRQLAKSADIIIENFKVGNQGTNFTATVSEYHALLNYNKKEDMKYWLFSPGEQAFAWGEQFQNNYMGLSWDELDDLQTYKSKDEIYDALVSH